MTTTTAVDPITLEVIRNRLDTIADEMQHVLLKSSHSIIIKEGGDASSAILSATGETIAHAVAIPLHLGVIGPLASGITAVYPVDQMRDGDVYLLNDPYGGGTHLPDITVVVPIVWEGATVGLAGVLSHHQDVGGMVPASMPANSREVQQEGLILPALKLYENDEPNDMLIRLISRNVREPEALLGDLRAQVAAARTGRNRYLELIEEYGLAEVDRYTTELLDRAERMTRAEIEIIPDGVYRYHDYLDHDGIDYDHRVRVEATVTVRGSDFLVDFTGTDAQTIGPVNGPPSGAHSAVAYVLRALSDPSIPINGGSERPIQLTLPEGTVVNPTHPAPVCLRGHLSRRIVDVLLGALAPALPAKVPACSASINGAHSYSGTDPQTNRTYSVTDTNIAAGMGALDGQDGTDAIEMHTTNLLGIPVEALEMSAPILVHANALRNDSGGPGRNRGGLGLRRVVELRSGSAVSCVRHERHSTQPWGLSGGGPGSSWSAAILHPDGTADDIPGKAIVTLAEGDVLHLETGGGGGFGDPFERDPQAVLEDWLDGKVSLDSARADYGVAIDVAARAVDAGATSGLREQAK